MMDEIKKNELNEQEMDNVAGGILSPLLPRVEDKKEQDEAVFEAVDTAWKVVKHALEDIF